MPNIDIQKKLISMKEKLISTSIDSIANLQDYASLAQGIDKDYFENLMGEIKKYSHFDGSLEEELKFLRNIKDKYNELKNLQDKYKKFYGLHSNESLSLSNVDVIDINAIDDRITIIDEYLRNKKEILEYKEKLEELNKQFILENSKSSKAIEEFLRLEKTLKSIFLSLQGRSYLGVYDVTTEYSDNGFDIKSLMDDNEVLENALNDATNKRIEQEESLNAALLCYRNNLDADYQGILNDYKKDATVAKYQEMLLRILTLIVNFENTYDGMLAKRTDILKLLEYRKDYLNELEINLLIDPFDSLDLQLQVNALHSIGDNTGVISSLKQKITEISEKLSDAETQKIYLNSRIGNAVNLIIDNKTLEGIIDENGVIFQNKGEVDLFNKVVGVRDSKLTGELIDNRTSSVIRRVVAILNDSQEHNVETAKVSSDYVEKSSISPVLTINKVDEDIELPLTGSVELPSLDDKKDLFQDGGLTIVEDDDLFTIQENPFNDNVVLFTQKEDDIFDLGSSKDSVSALKQENTVPPEESLNSIQKIKSIKQVENSDMENDVFWGEEPINSTKIRTLSPEQKTA